MTRLKFLSFVLICFCCLSAKAQQEFTVNGVLFEKGTKIRVALGVIYNKRNKYSVGSNDMGLFNIKAAVGDTLIITKRGFSDVAVAVGLTKDMVVYLTRNTMQLDEIVVYGQTKKQTMEDIKRDFKNKGSFYAGKPPFLAFLFTPLTAIYEMIGRTPKNARRFNNYYINELQQTHVDEFFNKAVVSKNTGLTGKTLEDFMMNYRPDYQKAKNWNQYDGIKYINEAYKKYADTAKALIK